MFVFGKWLERYCKITINKQFIENFKTVKYIIHFGKSNICRRAQIHRKFKFSKSIKTELQA